MAAPAQRASTEKDQISRILKLTRTEIQQLNLNRVLNELEQENILSKGAANLLKQKSASQKSNVLISVLQTRNLQDFKTFLEIVSAESDVKFKRPTKEFLSVVSIYPGYEDYCHYLERKVEQTKTGRSHNFVQVGDGSNFIVGRNGSTYYDPLHGITLHIPENSLPHDLEQIEVTVKVGFINHSFDVGMVMCSATVAIRCAPQIVFTKDVFLEIPHSASSADTSDLCFVKFDDVCDTDHVCGEIYNGIFPLNHPYGVIMTNSFSSYVIVKGKRFFYSKSCLKKTYLQRCRQLSLPNKLSKQLKCIDCVDKSTLNSFWFGIKKISTDNGNQNSFLFLVAQYTPTGFYAMREYSTKHAWEQWLSFNFASSKLVFHPQVAEDCGWKATADGFYEVCKTEAEKMSDGCGALRIPMVQYSLMPTQHELQIPSITVSVSGSDRRISHILTTKGRVQASASKCEALCNTLLLYSVVEDEFLRQLAHQLPVWQPIAQLLGLTAADIEHIEHNTSPSRGERAYKAILQWMQKEGRAGATYDVLLQALCQATDVSDCRSVTNAWWYAHQHLSNLWPIAT